MVKFPFIYGEGIIMFWTIFGGILVVKVKIKEINEVMIYNYGLDHTKLSKQFVFFLYSSSEYNDI